MNLKRFYEVIRPSFPLTEKNVSGFDFILTEAEKRDVSLHKLAYILATTWHETAATMQPIAEYGKGKGRKYGVPGKYGQVPYGRGYVQLTWDFNYEKADKELDLKGALLKDFDLAMDPQYAVQILFKGMEDGWFTGKGLDDYIDDIDESDEEDLKEFLNARRVINGIDKQYLIGQYAIRFEKALRASEYEVPFLEPQKPVETIPSVPSVAVPSETKTPTAASAGLVALLIKFFAFIGRNF